MMEIFQGWKINWTKISTWVATNGMHCYLGIMFICGVKAIPETAWAGSHGRRSAAFVPGDALSAEVLGEEVQFIRRRLEGQLVQLLLRWTGGLWEEEHRGSTDYNQHWSYCGVRMELGLGLGLVLVRWGQLSYRRGQGMQLTFSTWAAGGLGWSWVSLGPGPVIQSL